MATALETDNVSDLRRSRKIVGELMPVVRAKGSPHHDGETLNGRHRKEAGWSSVVEMQIETDLDFWVRRLHFLVQRRSTEQELMETFDNICSELEKGGHKTETVAHYVVANLSPFKEGYTLALIKDRYKRSGGYSSSVEAGSNYSQSSSSPMTATTDPSKVRFSFTDRRDNENSVSEIIYPCPRCGCPAKH
jgi:hypothetical protein